MYIAKIFLTLIIIDGASCRSENISFLDYVNNSDSRYQIPFLFLFSTFLLLSVIYNVLLNFDFKVPFGIFPLIIGFVWGFIIHYFFPKYLTTYGYHTNKMSARILSFYMPVVIFKTAFCLDYSTFVKGMSQIFVVTICVSLSSAFLVAFIIKFIVDQTWTYSQSIFFAFLTILICPLSTIHLLKEIVSHTKQVVVLLEGELMGTIVMVDIATEIMAGNYHGQTVMWYQFICVILRFLVIGTIAGFCMGWCGRALIRKMSGYPLSIVLISVGLPCFIFSVVQFVLAGSGPLSIMITGLMMGIERASLPRKISQFLIDFWLTITVILTFMTCLIGGTLAFAWVFPTILPQHFILVFITYIVVTLSRFLCFIIYSPILRRIGYGLTVKTLIVATWGGLKSPMMFIFAITYHYLYSNSGGIIIVIMHTVWVYLFSYAINGCSIVPLLQVMGMTKISMARQVNMDNCMKHILIKKNRTIAILKLDKFLADVNWSLVGEVTKLNHPYNVQMDESNGDNQSVVEYRFTTCPECSNEIIEPPTERELKEMSKEARMRILKAKKMYYSTQFENGMVSKESIRILSQIVEFAMNSDQCVIVLDDLYAKFQREVEKIPRFDYLNIFILQSCLIRLIRKRVNNLRLSIAGGTIVRPPRKYWRRVCYHIVITKEFQFFSYLVVFLNTIFAIVDLSLFSVQELYHTTTVEDYITIAANTIFFLLFLIEFLLKIFAFSFVYVCKHGFAIYFKSCWNTLDFIFLWGSGIDLLFNIIEIAISNTNSYRLHSIFHLTSFALKILRIVRFFKLLHICRLFYPNIIKYLDSRIDSNVAFAFEVAKVIATGEEELSEMLPQMIDHEQIRDEIKQKMEQDRVKITKMLGIVQKERPWIAITVKTKQAIRTIVNSMKQALKQLKASGWVDDYEQKLLTLSLEELDKSVNDIKSVQPCAPKVIFKEVSWMPEDDEVIKFLFNHVTMAKYEPNEIICQEGKVADGIFIVVTGLLMLNYEPDDSVINKLRESGRLPIVDYISSTQYEETVLDYIVSGNCVGELSTLTERPYNCTIKADIHTQVYVLSHGIIKQAMEMNSDPVNGLECRIWKAVSIRIAIPILMSIPAYHSLSQNQIKYTLERSFMPNLSNYNIFVVTDMIQDIVLIEGVVEDYNSKEMYVAPCYIPRTVQKLILPQSNLLKIPIDIETKLLIIPDKDVDGYDVMVNMEDICELKRSGSHESKCLQHLIQSRNANMRKRKKVMLDPNREKISKSYTQMADKEKNSEVLFKSPSPSVDSQNVLIDIEREARMLTQLRRKTMI